MGKSALIRLIANYFKTQPVIKAWLFGSYARGEENEKSDVDIIVSLDYSRKIGLKSKYQSSDMHKVFKGVAQRGNARWVGSLDSSCIWYATRRENSSTS